MPYLPCTLHLRITVVHRLASVVAISHRTRGTHIRGANIRQCVRALGALDLLCLPMSLSRGAK